MEQKLKGSGKFRGGAENGGVNFGVLKG